MNFTEVRNAASAVDVSTAAKQTKPATEAQIEVLRSIWRERLIPRVAGLVVRDLLATGQLSTVGASNLIRDWKDYPRRPAATPKPGPPRAMPEVMPEVGDRDERGRIYTKTHGYLAPYAAQALGRLRVQCLMCSRPLTNRLSRQRGVGPICWDRYGFGA